MNENNKNKGFLRNLLYAIFGLGAGSFKTIIPIAKTGVSLSLGIVSFAIGTFAKLAATNATDKDKEKLRQVERFFMSKEADDIRRNNARERFNNEIRALKEAEKQKKRRYNRIDGAFRLISVGAGLLAGGVIFEAINPIAGVGLGLLIGGAVGWVGTIINAALFKATEGKNYLEVPKRETIIAPQINNDAPNNRNELVQKVLLEAATSLQKLDLTIPKLRHPDSISAVTQLVKIGRKLMDFVAASPEKLSIAQRVLTYYCTEAVNVATGLAKIESDTKPDIERIIATQGILQKLVILFEKTELELKNDDNKSLDIDLKLLDQSLKTDLKS